MSSTKIKIEYGIFAGERTGSGLRRALRAASYGIVQKTEQADVIIAHSAGCFWLPETSAHQMLMLIDPPYWPNKTIRERAKARVRSNSKFRHHGYHLQTWLVRNLWGIHYAVLDARRTMRIIRYAASFDLETVIRSHDHILLIRNQYDDWLTPDFRELKRLNPHLQAVELAGDHDDLTHHPERYVQLLQSLQKEYAHEQ